MSTMEEVAAAEGKMIAAKDALLKYVEKRGTLDRDRYQRLVARFKKAEGEFLSALSKLV